MKVLLGSNIIENCNAALVIDGVEVFRLRERAGDERLVCDFDVRNENGERLAKISKNNVVFAADGYSVEHLPHISTIITPNGEILVKVEEIEFETIKITGNFLIDSHHVIINDDALISGGVTMSGNKISGFGKAILIEKNSFAIGVAR